MLPLLALAFLTGAASAAPAPKCAQIYYDSVPPAAPRNL